MLKKDGYLNNITNSDFNKELKIPKEYRSYKTHHKKDIHVMDHVGDYERIANEITNEVPHSRNSMHVEKRDPKSFTIQDDMRFDTHAPIDMLPLSRKVRAHADVYGDPRERKDLLEQDTRYDNYVQEQPKVSFTSYPLSETSKRNIDIHTQENKQNQTVTYNPHTTMETKQIKLGNPNVKRLLESISSTAVKSVQIHNNYPHPTIGTNKYTNTSSVHTDQQLSEKPNIPGVIQGGNESNPVSVKTGKYEMRDSHHVKIASMENLNVPFRQHVSINNKYTSGVTNAVLETNLHLNTQNNTKSIPTSHLQTGSGDVRYNVEEHGLKLKDTQIDAQPRHISLQDINHNSTHRDIFSSRQAVQLNTNKNQHNHDTHTAGPGGATDCIQSVDIRTSHIKNQNGTIPVTQQVLSNLQDAQVYLQSDHSAHKETHPISQIGSYHYEPIGAFIQPHQNLPLQNQGIEIGQMNSSDYEPIEAYIQTRQNLPLQNEQQEIGVGQIINKAHIQLNTARREQKDNINDKYGEHNINKNNRTVHVTSHKNDFVHLNDIGTPDIINTKKMQGLTYFNNKRENNPHMTSSKNNIKLKSTTPTASFETRGYISTFE
tara:strand:+ start:4711 stop:6510 length:1800 start_codon:yes stop_codon:yes gene_type:complete